MKFLPKIFRRAQLEASDAAAHVAKPLKDRDARRRENLDAFLVAVIMALVIRYYFIEAFKIPTSSMAPTLLGSPDWRGDRILVNKFIYHVRAPKRWDVIVFKYPHNTSRNFIKRLVGLPGENLRIKNGDIYINDKIARKPAHVAAALLQPLMQTPTPIPDSFFEEYWRLLQGEWSLEDAYVHLHGAGTLQYPTILNGEDLKLNLRVRCLQPDSIFYAELIETYQVAQEQHTIRLQLVTSGCQQKSTLIYQWQHQHKQRTRQIDLDFKMQPGYEYDISLANIDDLARVWVNGTSLAQIDYQRPVGEIPAENSFLQVNFGGRAGQLAFGYINLFRDIYYVNDGCLASPSRAIHIPPRRYFALGDNSPCSRDSRLWQTFCLILKRNGIAYRGDDHKNGPGPFDGYYEFVDTRGIPHHLHEEEVVFLGPPALNTMAYQQQMPDYFVRQDCLLGQAFLVFWPPDQIKFIH